MRRSSRADPTGVDDPAAPEVRRLIVDVGILEALGRFFAGKMRAAVRYELALVLGDVAPLADAVTAYREARAAWAERSIEPRASTSTI